jgi:hypothetical protein
MGDTSAKPEILFAANVDFLISVNIIEKAAKN